MAFSFSNWFKGKPGSDDENSTPAEDEAASPAGVPGAPPPLTLPKMASPGAVRQTQPVPRPAIRSVVPGSAQPANLRDPNQPRPPVPLGNRPLSAVPARPPAATPVAPPTKVSPAMPTARKIAFGGPAAPAMSGQATPSVPAIKPQAAEAPPQEIPEFTVSLTVGDFIDRLPPGLLNPAEPDRGQTVEFLSTEFYSDLAKGRASVPASVIYAKCPAIFARPVSETEDAEVQLPLPKIVEQMSAALQTRPDQVNEDTGAEIETPFLHVANEDNARLPKANGTTVGALPGGESRPPFRGADLPASVARSGMQRTGQISAISPVKAPAEVNQPLAAPAAAASGAINPGKRPPSTVRASVAGSKIRLSGPTSPAPSIVPAANQPGAPAGATPPPAVPTVIPAASSPSHQVAKKTARIQIPPISLRTAGAPSAGGPRPPVAFTPPVAAPVPAQPPSFRAVPPAEQPVPDFRPVPPVGETGAATFRTSPPPPPTPPSTKRVPASFAPSVRPSFPPPAFPAAPPSEANPPAAPSPASGEGSAAPADDRKIEIGLAAILRGLPSSTLTVDPTSIPDGQKISLPFAPIEKQLSKGRISVTKVDFVAALPEAHRAVLADDADLAEIPIPLQEVFQNLPANALGIRADQVIEEITHIYPTPFSQKADEDAQRLGLVEPVKPASSAAEPLPPADEAPVPAPAEAETPDFSLDPLAGKVEEQGKSAPGIQIPEDQTLSSAANLIDTEEASIEEPGDPAVESAHQAPASEAHLDAPASESPALADSTLTDRAEAHTFQDEPAADPAGLPALEEPAAAEAGQAHEPPVFTAATPPPEESAPSSREEEPVALPEEALPEPAAPAFPAPIAFEPASGTEGVSSADVAPIAPPAAVTAAATKPASARVSDTVLQTLFMTEDDLDAKAIVKHISQLPGVNGCAIMFGDGLPLAGNFPDGNEKAGFSAMAPPFFKRTLSFTDELKLGGLEAFTLYTAGGLLSFFMHGDICVSVRHAGRGFLPGVREKLDTVTRELARIYSTEKPAASDPHAGHHI